MSKLLTRKKESGVVLVVSLVFLVALTAVAAALMQNSTTDMKMSGASEAKAIAIQEVVSGVDEVIFNQVSPGRTNLFSRPVEGGNNFPINDQKLLLPDTVTQSTATVVAPVNSFNLSNKGCPRGLGFDTDTYDCNNLIIAISHFYGRTGTSSINVNSNVAQLILKNN